MKKERLPAHQKYADLIRKSSVDAVERINKELYPVCEDLVDHLVTDIYGFSSQRPHIDIRVRHLISLGVLAAMGGCEPQLNFQLEAALNLEIPPDEVKEVFIQVAVFAGNARAINAANIFHKILMQRNSDGENTQP
jgi:4-carboxymuconolactone decarboxylase